jgi:hypothetical protein
LTGLPERVPSPRRRCSLRSGTSRSPFLRQHRQRSCRCLRSGRVERRIDPSRSIADHNRQLIGQTHRGSRPVEVCFRLPKGRSRPLVSGRTGRHPTLSSYRCKGIWVAIPQSMWSWMVQPVEESALYLWWLLSTASSLQSSSGYWTERERIECSHSRRRPSLRLQPQSPRAMFVAHRQGTPGS